MAILVELVGLVELAVLVGLVVPLDLQGWRGGGAGTPHT